MCVLKKLTVDDNEDVYNLLQSIDTNENEFKNPVNGMTYDQYKMWLIQQNDWSNDLNLPDGYVGQTIFWLYDSEKPIGMGKIRHKLTDSSREAGGNIGYAISKATPHKCDNPHYTTGAE